MALLLRACALFLLISLCQAKKPTLTPSESTIYKTEGESLVLKCTSDHPTTFYTQLKDPKKKSRSTEETSGVVGGPETHYFRKKSLVVGDSGYYGCADSNIKVDKTKQDQPNVSWVNVYVTSKKPVIKPSKSPLVKNEGDNLEISCETWIQDQQPQISVVYNDPTAETSETSISVFATGESHKGQSLAIKSLLPGDSGWYACADSNVKIDTHRHDQSDVTWIYVSVHSKAPKIFPNKPTINIKLGQELKIKCTGHRGIKFYTKLDSPKEASKVVERTHTATGSLQEHTLEKKAVVIGDSGWYGCAYDNVKVDVNEQFQDDVSWTYVNVEHFFFSPSVDERRPRAG